MAGWCSESESECDDPLNFNLFVRKSFGFRGFSKEREQTLKKIVTHLGAICDDTPKYVFTTSEYYNSLTENNTPLFNVTFIRDSVDANRCLSAEQYRFGSKVVEKDFRDFDPCCHYFHNGKEACNMCDPSFKEEVPKQKRRTSRLVQEASIDKCTNKNKMKQSHDKSNASMITTKTENICTIVNCPVGSAPHPSHPKRRESYEPWECRLMLDYIICNNLFTWVKSPSLYRRMYAEGFLIHRSPESLRVQFRTKILPTIETFNLPKPILKKFRQIRKGTFLTARSRGFRIDSRNPDEIRTMMQSKQKKTRQPMSNKNS